MAVPTRNSLTLSPDETTPAMRAASTVPGAVAANVPTRTSATGLAYDVAGKPTAYTG